MKTVEQQVKEVIRTVPNFPSEGINFKDITPLLGQPRLAKEIVKEIVENVALWNPTCVAGIESRGFLFGFSIAAELNIPFIPIRKKGKLPMPTASTKYDLEYGMSEIEVHLDAVKPNDRVLIHDDLLATGGTALAAAELIESLNAQVVGYSFLVELGFLSGRQRLNTTTQNFHELVTY